MKSIYLLASYQFSKFDLIFGQLKNLQALVSKSPISWGRGLMIDANYRPGWQGTHYFYKPSTVTTFLEGKEE